MLAIGVVFKTYLKFIVYYHLASKKLVFTGDEVVTFYGTKLHLCVNYAIMLPCPSAHLD